MRYGCILLVLALATSASANRRFATADDLDAAIRALPKRLGSSVYAKKKDVSGKQVRVSDYVGVTNGKPAFLKNAHRTKEEFQAQLFLDCTTFATPVLHRILRGTFRGFSQGKVNGYGHTVAAYHRLKKSYQSSTPKFLENAKKADWRKVYAGVYFFDLRRGKLGHIGFAVVGPNGIRHVQMSMTHKPGPLDDADFAKYLSNTTYAKQDGTVTLYRLTVEPSRAPAGR